MRPEKIVVFDLGKVLVDFDYSIAARKIAARSRMSLDDVNSFIGGSEFTVKYELGLVTRRGFFERARQAIGFGGTFAEFGEFFADIFTEIPPMVELHAGLRQRGVPTYIFSNTNDLAVEHIRRNFLFFKKFDGYIFSYEIGALKPDAKIYEALETLAGRRGADILYLDDRPENVAAGATRGWRAILHETPEKSRVAVEKFLS
ncbi:MAG TPA: HAD family phosphatase [Candidatus Nitrosopolaris sp.]|nr:HAD family phosphatase [Candidatus Nitrosopolaris sp.]